MPGDLLYQGFPSGSEGKESACNAGNPGLRKQEAKVFRCIFCLPKCDSPSPLHTVGNYTSSLLCQFPGYFSSLTGHPVPNPRHMLDFVILLLATDFSVHQLLLHIKQSHRLSPLNIAASVVDDSLGLLGSSSGLGQLS